MPSQKFGNLLEAVPDALLGVDRAGVIRLVNRQAESLFGYERQDLIGASIEMLVPESLRQVHKAHRAGYNASPRTRPMGTDLKLVARRADGSEFPVDIALSPMHPGDRMLVMAAVRDLTNHFWSDGDRRRLDRLAAIVKHSDDAIISSTPDGIITSWNPAAERLYGYSSQEIIGRSGWLLVPKSQADEIERIHAKIRTGGHVANRETIRVRKDGSLVPVAITVSPIGAPAGTIIGPSSIARDLSTQEEATHLSRSMIEASLKSMVAISLEGKITDANQATVKFTGVGREELIGTSFSDYFTEPEKAEEVYQRVLT